MSRIALFVATAAVVASLLVPTPARAKPGSTAPCTDGGSRVLNTQRIHRLGLSLRVAAFTRAVRAAQALDPVARGIHVMVNDCPLYTHSIVTVPRARFSSSGRRLPRNVYYLEYNLHISVGHLRQLTLVELARSARTQVCIVHSGALDTLFGITVEPISLELTACKLEAAVAASDSEPAYREWFARTLPPDIFEEASRRGRRAREEARRATNPARRMQPALSGSEEALERRRLLEQFRGLFRLD